MDKTILMSKAASGVFTAEEQAHLTTALATQDQVDQAIQMAGAINWAGLLGQILPVILGLFTGGAGTALVPLINLILNIFKLPPLPNPAPNGGGVIPPTPVP